MISEEVSIFLSLFFISIYIFLSLFMHWFALFVNTMSMS